jgi:hypothetical protein
MTHPNPTHIDDPGDLSLKIEGYNINLSALDSDSVLRLPPHIARWVASELLILAADVDRKAARAVCDKAAEVMK